jgi:hypothetical protein
MRKFIVRPYFKPSIMKWIVIVLFLANSFAYGQRLHGTTPFDDRAIFDKFKKEDSLDRLYTNDSLLKVIIDTLPLYAFDDNDGWRNMKLVYYFYDSSNVLKKIFFRNGRDGSYYFYFEETYLKKVRSLKWAPLINSKYYFSIEDNNYTLLEISQRITQEPEKKNLYETLKLGKIFFEKFKTLL